MLSCRSTTKWTRTDVLILGTWMARMDSDALRMELAQLRQEHRDLDVAVQALASTSNHDVLQLQRLKKKKLKIKDRISALEDQLFPDIIA